MFFGNDIISFILLDVLELKQKNVNMHNNKRNFNALSFRFRADTVLKSETEARSDHKLHSSLWYDHRYARGVLGRFWRPLFLHSHC